MKTKGDDFLKRLLSTFKVEAAEHVKALSSGLIDLERVPAEQRAPIIEAVFREVHSLKGAARAVGHAEIEGICQSMEGVFSSLKRQEVMLSPGMLDVLHSARRCLEGLLSLVEAELPTAEKSAVAVSIRQLEDLLGEQQRVDKQREPSQSSVLGSPPPAEAPLQGEALSAQETPASSGATVRIGVSKLNSILHQAEGMLSAKLAVGQRTADMENLGSTISSWRPGWRRIHSDLKALQRSLEKTTGPNGLQEHKVQLARVFEFLEWNHAFIRSLENEVTTVARLAMHDRESIGAMVDNLLDDAKKALMLPFSSLLEILPEFVRDLSRDQGKDAKLELRGTEIEVDRRVLEEMKDPLIHLVRNCIDHGIEKSKEREKKKKPTSGTIMIAVSQKDSDKVEIAIADDGCGIQAPKVRSAAIKLGVISPDQSRALSEQDVLQLIFHSGVSTSPLITEVSGRGLGLAIVAEKVERLGGTLTFETLTGVGTTFRIVLPLTLAAFRGLLVRSSDQLFVLPTLNVDRTLIVRRDEITSVENMQAIQLGGTIIPLVRLDEVLQLTGRDRNLELAEHVPVVVLLSAEKRVAFLVDEVLHEQEVLMKSLGPQLSRVRNIASSTVLGNGKVVPVLNVHDLMKSATGIAKAGITPEVVPAKRGEEKQKSILVVEDSITARTLLKNILESGGYDVATAVDGLDAFTQLRTGEFDVVVSDVDMPRMNGFDLTAKIRGDKKLSAIPVVLVTALETREDRERGIDVGADAYIVKSSFDQSNLLEVVRRLA